MHRSAPADIPINNRLIGLLHDTAAYPHPVSEIDMIETHISWVLLAGDYVYKIKKPLNLDFLDFSDLGRRRFYCEEEIRLNKPWAPNVYIDVVPITLNAGVARVGGDGQAIEYAVRMRRFDQAMRLDAQLDAGLLSADDMRELGSALARRHLDAPAVAKRHREHTVRCAIEFIVENFEPLTDVIEKPLLDELRAWTEHQISIAEPLFMQRFDDGFFRECHGDLHLGNLVRLPDGIATFDCIEFNDDLRNIDVIADIAFLVMDLVAKDELHLAAHFLNRYLEFTGDYQGMRFFNLYFTYRCLVRAKIGVIRSRERTDAEHRRQDLQEAVRYCEMARRQIRQRVPLLVVMTGLSGSGKTWVSTKLMAALPAIRVRSDIERKRHFGLDETADSGSDIASGLYTAQASTDVYEHLNALAETLLDAGHNTILDGTFLHSAERAAARSVASRKNAGFVIVQTIAEDSILRERVRARHAQHRDASEAGASVLDYQRRHAEELTKDESLVAVCCRSDNLDVPDLIAAIRDRRCG